MSWLNCDNKTRHAPTLASGFASRIPRTFLRKILQARAQLAWITFAFLEIRQDSAEKKAHQEDVGSHNSREEWVDGDHLPPEEMNEKFCAYDYSNDGAHA